MILVSWAFIFGGMAGLYQAKILNPVNTQQIIFLLLIMIGSLFAAVKVGIGQIRGKKTNINDLWQKYIDGVTKSELDKIELMETVMNDHLYTLNQDDKNISKLAELVEFAGYFIIAEMFFIVLFIIFPNLRVVL